MNMNILCRERGEVSSGGIGLVGLVFIVFLVLKLIPGTAVSSWSWWWVTAPLWGSAALAVIIVLFVAFIAYLANSRSSRR